MINKERIYEFFKDLVDRYRDKRQLDRDFSRNRIVSIDFMRGILVIFSLMVINQGLENHISPNLKISPWNGMTFADLLVPMFLIVVGASLPFFVKKYLRIYDSFSVIVEKVTVKAAVLFVLGVLLGIVYDFGNIKILGPIQLIAIDYLLISLIYLGMIKLKIRNNNLGIVMVLTALIWSMVFTIISNINGFTISENIFVKVDRSIIGLFMDEKGIEPNGILASLAALALPMFGVSIACIFNKKHVSEKKYIKYTRNSSIKKYGLSKETLLSDIKTWMNPNSIRAMLSNYYRLNDDVKKIVDMLLLFVSLFLFSHIIEIWIPLNRNTFSISFVTRVGSYMYLIMNILYVFFDIAKRRKYGKLIARMGMNSILIITLSVIFYKLINLIHIKSIYTGTWLSLNNWTTIDFIVPVFGMKSASFIYALVATAVCMSISFILEKKDIKINL